jgi:hypothetical protein
MLGIFSEYTDLYLWVAALSTLLFFGLPLCLFPLRWAGWMHWKIPAHTHLTVYFGRCLGAVVCVMSLFALVAAKSDRIVCSFYYQFLLVNIAAMIALHLYGALTKTQPITETIEIAFWAVLFITTLCFYPV